MSSDSTGSSPPNDTGRNRRGSVTSAAFSNLFQRSNSTSTGSGNASTAPSVGMAAAMDQRRRLSVTTLGLSGGVPSSSTVPFAGLRRGSISTNNSDSIDENAVDDDEAGPRTAPTTPFARRMSFGAQAMRSMRAPGGTSPGSTDQGFNWSEQLRSRAESSVSGARPIFGAGGISSSPPRGNGNHDRAKSVSDMPAPPQQAAALKPKQPERPKPDHMQERILKGDFYMD